MTYSLNVFLLLLKTAVICVLIAADIFLVTLLFVSFGAPSLHAASDESLDKSFSFRLNIEGTAKVLNDKTGNTLKYIGNTVGSTAHVISSVTSNVAENIVTTVTNPETIIKPEPSDKTPEIEKTTEVSPATGTGGPAANQPSLVATAPVPTTPIQSPQASVWPIHGTVTTEFGVYHQPFQGHHTGIDIASELPVGSGAVTPFREGTVAEVIRSSGGLGNHIVIDHGSGLTSWYGHLYSIAVAEGQVVKPGDSIGYEGRTGTATGPHLHLEIRQNNVPLNPRKFIAGNP
jgi:murein DD-endopeptidase MepM/ murein hydrolase activator NlpD